jgi:uncharacterized protein (TIGR02266 family)
MSRANNPVPAVQARSPRQEAQITELAVESTREGSGRYRRNARAAVELDVSLGSDHNFYAGFVENLSAGGVFVATHLLRPVGEVIELSIYVSDDEQVVTGTGEVRWLREYNEASDVPPGMGVKFLSLTEGSEKIIQRFLAQRDPMFFDDEDEVMPDVVAPPEPEATAKAESVKPDATVSVKPEAGTSVKPEASASVKPDATMSVGPEATASVKPEATESVKPEAGTSVKPEATESVKPEAAESVKPEAGASVKPEASASVKPEVSAAAEEPAEDRAS